MEIFLDVIRQRLGQGSAPVNQMLGPFMSKPTAAPAPVTPAAPAPTMQSRPGGPAFAPVAPTAPAPEVTTDTTTEKKKTPIKWDAIRKALLKKYPNANKTQVAELDKKLEKAKAWEAIQFGASPEDYREDYPDLYTRALAEGIPSKGTEAEDSETSNEVNSVVDKLLKSDLGPITGIAQVRAAIPGTKASYTKNLFNQLKGMLSLENRQQLKGSGAISDFEFRILGEASTALDRNLSADDFKTVLEELKTKLSEVPKKGTPTTIGRFQVEVQ